jgi:hypothetical protein
MTARSGVDRTPEYLTTIGLMAGLAAIGVAAAVARRPSSSYPRTADRTAQLRRYLADHLTGSDAAFAVVDRLRASRAGASEAELFERLHREFAEERYIVRAMLQSLGGSPLEMKRLIGQAAGSVLQTAAGGEPGDLALFRTLESLAVGVQGKRCLWRVARTLEPLLSAPGAKNFEVLEIQALDQWQHIERHRLALSSSTFAAAHQRGSR